MFGQTFLECSMNVTVPTGNTLEKTVKKTSFAIEEHV